MQFGSSRLGPGAAGGNRSGFTLIELLAVITIILILSGLALGVGRLASQKAKFSRLEADMKRICAAIERYGIDRGNYAGMCHYFEGSLNIGAYGDGLPSRDPWDEPYRCTSFDPVVNRTHLYGARTVAVQHTQYIVWSTGPDRKPGVAGVDDDGRNGLEPTVDGPGGWNVRDFGEAGYGDDIVRGNITMTRGFVSNEFD